MSDDDIKARIADLLPNAYEWQIDYIIRLVRLAEDPETDVVVLPPPQHPRRGLSLGPIIYDEAIYAGVEIMSDNELKLELNDKGLNGVPFENVRLIVGGWKPLPLWEYRIDRLTNGRREVTLTFVESES